MEEKETTKEEMLKDISLKLLSLSAAVLQLADMIEKENELH